MTPLTLAFETRLLDDVPSLLALRSGFRSGLLATLQQGPITRELLITQTPLPAAGLDTLLALFWQVGIAEQEGDSWQLSGPMRDLLEAEGPALRQRADFVALAVCDVLMHGDGLLGDPRALRQAAATFRFFCYDRASGTGAAQLEDTAPWVGYVSALAAREAPDLAPLIPLDGVRHLLEVGGNTGVFARALLAARPGLTATVLDLPAVCHIGAADLPQDMAGRLHFLPGDARAIDWPQSDAVLFKSVLHDWTEAAAREMIAKAARHLPPGGRVIICERGPVAEENSMRGAAAAANLVFAQYYRTPAFYEAALEAAGLRLLPRRSVSLEMTFHMVAAERA